MFWFNDSIGKINRTIGLFDKIVTKLSKYVSKCLSEMENIQSTITYTKELAEATVEQVKKETGEKIEMLKTKAEEKEQQTRYNADKTVADLNNRHADLVRAVQKARVVAKNLEKITSIEL